MIAAGILNMYGPQVANNWTLSFSEIRPVIRLS